MNLKQLEAFRAAFQSGTVTGAARLLSVSQPSVSRLLSDLERSLGFALFMRTVHGLEPTMDGRRFYNAVEKAFIGLADLRQTAEGIRTHAEAEITVGVVPAFSQHIAPQAIRLLVERFPTARITVSVLSTPAIVDGLRARRFDLGLISPMRDYPDLRTLMRGSVRYVCLAPKTHSVAQKKASFDLMTLEDESFVSFDRTYLSFLTSDHDLVALLLAKSRVQSHSTLAVAALSKSLGAIAIIDELTAQTMAADTEMVTRPLRQNLRFPIAIVSGSEAGTSKLADEFAQILRTILKARGVRSTLAGCESPRR